MFQIFIWRGVVNVGGVLRFKRGRAAITRFRKAGQRVLPVDAAVKGYEVGILIGEIVVQVQGENPVAEKPQPILNAPVVVVSDVIAKPDVRRLEISKRR